ncbi:MAG: uncharacterized protein JWN48_3719 [Myxococcaceae bacterium]|nr:uncharacterized protein [Myxococcaceae bacterium]
MNGRTMSLGRVFGVALLALGALSATGCPGDDSSDSDGGMSGGLIPGLGAKLAEQCGLSCPAAGKGVAYGNASISGYAPIDGFFRSVINYNTVAAGVSADIDGELAGIQSLFQVSATQLKASGGDLGAAIKAKLAADFKASVVVNAQPAQCSVDAKVAASVSAKCQAEANCTIDPGMASFQCMGTCNVDATIDGKCAADAKVRCNVTAPSFDCQGECNGTCTVSAPKVDCAARCSGTCSGTCSADASGGNGTIGANGVCNGTCTGMCSAGCEVTGMAALSCNGSCNGSCEYTPASGSCDASAKVTCDLNASASASCSGRCDGSFTPPSAMCNASASCQASAKAEARFQVHCTPPTVEVKVVAQGGVMAQAQVDFLIDELKARLPRLSVATARAKLASDAGAELSASGTAGVQATAKGLGNGEVDFIVGAKVVACVPAQLTEAQTVIGQASAALKVRTDSAASVAKTFAMVM